MVKLSKEARSEGVRFNAARAVIDKMLEVKAAVAQAKELAELKSRLDALETQNDRR